MRLLAILLLLGPQAGSAAELSTVFCEPLARLNEQVNYCDENHAYVPAAQKCFQDYKAAVDAENAKIQAVLDKEATRAKGAEQETSFQTSQAVLASAMSTLASLLLRGTQVHNEIDDYSQDLVLPIYDAYPEDYDLDPHSAEAQQILREKECYGEPAEDLDAVMADLRKILTDLAKTKEKVAALHKGSVSRDDQLGSLAPTKQGKNKGLGQGSVRVPAGKSKNGASSITGIEESKKKSNELPK
jgi:hypothetical protein